MQFSGAGPGIGRGHYRPECRCPRRVGGSTRSSGPWQMLGTDHAMSIRGLMVPPPESVSLGETTRDDRSRSPHESPPRPREPGGTGPPTRPVCGPAGRTAAPPAGNPRPTRTRRSIQTSGAPRASGWCPSCSHCRRGGEDLYGRGLVGAATIREHRPAAAAAPGRLPSSATTAALNAATAQQPGRSSSVLYPAVADGNRTVPKKPSEPAHTCSLLSDRTHAAIVDRLALPPLSRYRRQYDERERIRFQPKRRWASLRRPPCAVPLAAGRDEGRSCASLLWSRR